MVIDHRADIYSLGTTLYELLTLEPPFAESDRKELLKQIAFQEPRLLRKLDRDIPADLETIVLKTMAKDPDERYQSAESLAADLRAFLENRPISARPPGLLDRGRKWSRRNPGVIAAAVVILILTTIGLTISNFLIAQERTAAQAAKDQETEQRKVAEKKRDEARNQRIEAERQKKIAEENFQRARKSVDDYFTKVSESQLLDVPSLQPLRKDLLELALKYYEQWAKEHQDDPAIRAELAATHLRLGKIYTLLGSQDSARTSLEKALQEWKTLLEKTPASIPYRSQQAQTYLELGRLQKSAGEKKASLASFEQAVLIATDLVRADNGAEQRHLLAQAHHDVGQIQMSDSPAVALPSLHQAASLWEKLLADKRDVLRFQSKLAQVRQNIYHAEINNWTRTGVRANTTKTPEQIAAEASALAELRKRAADLEKQVGESQATSQQEELATLSYSLGDVIEEQAEALPHCKRAVAIYAKLAGENPAVLEYKFLLARAYKNLSRRQAGLGWTKAEDWKRDEGIRSEREAIRILEELTRLHPENAQFQGQLGHSYYQLTNKLLWSPIKMKGTDELVFSGPTWPVKSDHEEEIIQLYEKAIDRLEIAVKLDPQDDWASIQLSGAYRAFAERQPLEEREELVLASVELLKNCAAADPNAPKYREAAEEQLNSFYQAVAGQLAQEKKFAEAVAYWRKAIDLCTHPVAFRKDDTQPNVQLAFALKGLAATQILQGNRAEGIETYSEGIQVLKRLGNKYEYAKGHLCSIYYWRGRAQSEEGREKEAAGSWKLAMEQVGSDEEMYGVADWEFTGQCLYRLGRYSEAQPALKKCLSKLPDKEPTLFSPWWYLAMTQHRLGKTQEAKVLFDQLDALLKKVGNRDPGNLRLRVEAAKVLGIESE